MKNVVIEDVGNDPSHSTLLSHKATPALSADQQIVHPLLAQLLTTWSCMILDYSGTVERMKAASRPHDAARYEAKMETIAWCSHELTAVAKRLPLPSPSSVTVGAESGLLPHQAINVLTTLEHQVFRNHDYEPKNCSECSMTEVIIDRLRAQLNLTRDKVSNGK